MIKNLLIILLVAIGISTKAQEKQIWIQGAKLHIGDGTVIESGLIGFQNGIINYIGTGAEIRLNRTTSTIIDGSGKQIYPGFIALNTIVGLNEIDAVRATRDYNETGEMNPNIRSMVAFNTDSKILPTLRHNGVHYVQSIPQGGTISGTSSTFSTSGWNWEDAVVKKSDGMHIDWPSMQVHEAPWMPTAEEQRKRTEKVLVDISDFFEAAKAYCSSKTAKINLKFEAMRPLLDGNIPLFIHVDEAKGIIMSLELCKKFKLKPVIVGGAESYAVVSILKERNVPVILERTHRLPSTQSEAVDLPYKLPSLLTKAGILVAVTADRKAWEQRNLCFNAGTAAAYGLTKEEALQLISLNPAKILGLNAELGTLAVNKKASISVANGDLLDMKTSVIETFYLDGVSVDFNGHQQELNKKYKNKYGLK